MTNWSDAMGWFVVAIAVSLLVGIIYDYCASTRTLRRHYGELNARHELEKEDKS